MLSEIDLTHHYTISDIEKPERNCVAFFLGFDCNLKYNYCINLHDNGSRLEQAKRKQMSASDWITAANRLASSAKNLKFTMT